MAGSTLISIRQAAAQGVQRLRQPVWVNAFDHLEIDVFDGRPGPWARLFCPINTDINGRDPVVLSTILELDTNAEIYIPHLGPAHDSDAYRAAVEACARVKARITERDGMIVVEAEAPHG